MTEMTESNAFLPKRIAIRAKKLERSKDKPVAVAVNASFSIGEAAVALGDLDECVEPFIESPDTKAMSFASEWQNQKLSFFAGEKDKTAELSMECTIRKASLLKKETKKEGDLVVLRFHIVADEIEGQRDTEQARDARKFLDEMARLGLPWYLDFREGKGTQQVIPGTPNSKIKTKYVEPTEDADIEAETDGSNKGQALEEKKIEEDKKQNQNQKSKRSTSANPGPEGQAMANMIDRAVKLAKECSANGGFSEDQLEGDDDIKTKALKRLIDSGTLKKTRVVSVGGRTDMYSLGASA